MNDKTSRYVAYLWIIDMLNIDSHGGSEHIYTLMEDVGLNPDIDDTQSIRQHIEAQREIYRKKISKMKKG